MRLFPMFLLGIFSSDPVLKETALPCFNLYFSTFIFMVFQHGGQSTFKSLGKKNHAIFFSLFRKAVIVIPLTYLLPYVFHMGTTGVFAAEPISNVVGGLACFITMLRVVLPELREETV
jgi:Na+-driven multidrug efflux pump